MNRTLRISTMTALCNMGCLVPLDKLYENLNPSDIVKSVEYQDKPIKGVKKTKKKKKKKCFYNQLTVVVHVMNKDVNVKIFKNGKIQITGIKSEENGKSAAQAISSFIEGSEGISEYKTVLINSDFNVGFPVYREKLYRLFVDEYDIFVNFEPCIYPGVNAKYYWNSDPVEKGKLGVCTCTKNCNGKGNGSGDGNCKRVTMSTFQSGTVIITGANTKQQLYDVYNFLLDIFHRHRTILEKKELLVKKINQ